MEKMVWETGDAEGGVVFSCGREREGSWKEFGCKGIGVEDLVRERWRPRWVPDGMDVDPVESVLGSNIRNSAGWWKGKLQVICCRS